MISELLEKEVQLKIKAKNWQDALRQSAEPLLKEGKITGSYIEEMIKSVLINGPYIVIAPGIAVGHARPSEKVIETAISFSTLETPINFGSKSNDPVDLVIIIASTDNENHLILLQKIVDFLSNKQNLRLSRTAKTVQDKNEIVKLINKGGVL